MANWFGDLQLAWKYALVFGSLLALTIVAGLIKVCYDRRRVKKAAKKEDLEAGPKEDQVELNRREKDEGDLFGIRAIEAGFFAGIPQSRPTSRAGSIAGDPSMSSSTLVGGFNSPKIKSNSMASSVTSLPLAHTAPGNRDSETLPSNSPPRRLSPPAMKLRPSSAELNGRMYHSAAVNMTLDVPPSPVQTRSPTSPTFGGSDAGSSDGQRTPEMLSPQSSEFKPAYYSPNPPQIPMPEGLRVTYHSGDDTARSQAASFTDFSLGASPGHSAPPSPNPSPETRIPTMPTTAMQDGPSSSQKYQEPEIRVAQPKISEPEESASLIRLQPRTYQPTHARKKSDASSTYSAKGKTIHQDEEERSNSRASSYSYNYGYASTEQSNRHSVALSANSNSRPIEPSSHLAPGSNNLKDTRLSEFYDAYYNRQSMISNGQPTDPAKRPNALGAEPTITEVDTPIPSPRPAGQPGMAL